MRTLQRSRIIERPRLLTLLDESTARVRTLFAAAGYGKTTLAEQWVTRGGRRSAWYTARSSSVDVAALALGVARSASTIVEGCESRLREHMRAISAAAGNVAVLAEILSEDLAEWPREAWLVIDDYQEIVGASQAEAFVADLLASCPLQLLLTTRQRPSWVTARSILYGDVFEINQTALAMDNQEAAEVLADWSGMSASGLVALANGWPAVIGLASVSSAEIESDDTVPESLYRFFAEEVFDALGDEVRDGLALLAVAPVMERELAAELLGDGQAESICAAALEVGILVERDERLELHPLARSFLEERGVPPVCAEATATCLAHYKARRDWGAAFDVVSKRDAVSELEALLAEALDDLLETARLPTVESWCAFAAKSGIGGPLFSLARAETALRQGRHVQAQAHAEAAAVDGKLAFRALSVAGRAAHLASREEEGLALYQRAESAATDGRERRAALWDQVICAVELDLPETSLMLNELSVGVSTSDPREFIRAATCRLIFDMRSGTLDLGDSDLAWELLPVLGEPLIQTGFESIYANALALAARYTDALEVANTLLHTAQKYRLDFARPYGLVSAAMGQAGMRQWNIAADYLDEAAALARDTRNHYAELFAFAARLRLLTQQGLHRVALALPLPDVPETVPAVGAEVTASRALALAAADRLDEAQATLSSVESSPAVESIVLSAAVRAITSLKLDDARTASWVSNLEEKAFATGAVDLLVTAYRAVPELLVVLLRRSGGQRLMDLVRRVGDHDLLRPLGVAGWRDDDPCWLLTRREREVYELLRQGLSNQQIADVLVISKATAKLHAQHIYNKLGIHSRKALAIQAALERSRQATSATAENVDAAESTSL